MIRKARMDDVPAIRNLVNIYADQGEMLAISLNNVYDRLRDFFVYEKDDKIVGSVALHFVWENLGEVRSLAVAKEEQGQGIARELVNAAIEEAKDYTCSRIFTLTYVPEFFKNWDSVILIKMNCRIRFGQIVLIAQNFQIAVRYL